MNVMKELYHITHYCHVLNILSQGLEYWKAKAQELMGEDA